MMSQGPITAQITATGTESMGQLTYQTLTCKHHHKLTIIMAYQPCQQGNSSQTKIHTLTVHAHQKSLLRQQGCTCSP